MSKSDRAAFLQAIQSDPTDLTARLVYADYLDECGDLSGELVRLLCEAQMSGYADGKLWNRLANLCGPLPQAGTRWRVALSMGIRRLSTQQKRLFACDCGQRVLPHFELERPDDDRPRHTIEVARRYAFEMATRADLAAAKTAARAASDVIRFLIECAFPKVVENSVKAARAAAWAIAWAADSPPTNAAVKASDIARGAAGSAVGNFDIGTVTEGRWQLCRVVEYRLGFVPPPLLEE